MHTVVGIDLGTQQLKVVFYDFERRQIAATEHAPLDLYQSDTGVAEQQSHWWLNALRAAMGKVDADVRRTARAIGVSGQQHGFVALDESGEVLAPVKLWCDTSTEVECGEIMDSYGGAAACLNDLGNCILPGYTASKIRWLGKSRPQLYARMKTVLLPHDYLNFYLTGERCMEMGDASGTGILDIRERRWSEALLRAIDDERNLGDCLPSLRSGNEPIGVLLAGVAEELDLPRGIPVSIGGGDNMMGAIGTGNVTPGKMTMSLGTSGTVYAYSDKPVVDPKGNIAAFCSSTGGWLPLLCTMNCTVSTELMRGLLGADIASFEAQISFAPRGADGVLTLPFFNGERTPNLPHARGCIVGLSSSNTKPANLLRSAVEGATFALRFGIEELAALGVQASEIMLTGGGVDSAKWRQLVADICGAPVTVLDNDEGAAFGAALQALQVLQDGADIADLTREHLARDEGRCCEPRKAAVNFYNDAYREYQRAVEAVAGMYS
jgi:xylulokinase